VFTYVETTLSVQGLVGLLEVLRKGEDGWLNNGCNVAVMIPPNTSMMLVVVRFELAKRCQVV
jgi:hypothetical protein